MEEEEEEDGHLDPLHPPLDGLPHICSSLCSTFAGNGDDDDGDDDDDDGDDDVGRC